VRVARHQMGEPRVEQLPRGAARPTAEPAVERGGGELHDHTAVDERAKPLRLVLHVGVPLRVCEHDAEPAQLEIEHEVGELERPPEVRELEQEERRIAAEAEAPQLVVVELGRVAEIELAAGEHLHGDRRLAGGAAELGVPQLHLARGRGIVLADVRRRGEARGAVLVRCAQQLEALAHRAHAVVDGRKNVRMQVDHGSPS
jgi:hypothetical protein